MESHISGATRGRGHRYEQRYGPAARTSQHDRGGAVGASRAERPDPIVAFVEDGGYGRVCREGSVCGHDPAAIKPGPVGRRPTWPGRWERAVIRTRARARPGWIVGVLSERRPLDCVLLRGRFARQMLVVPDILN